ncbi:hypothetical protein MNBD_DELTA01-513 [hydrothermal vent metagenome]|uniref:M23ase beta-sheet core domain-containing protein n=1 Tax=hydrothermal vent metagenome TaxID=652676 RepID=A0A3B0QU18_9ZZZZ
MRIVIILLALAILLAPDCAFAADGSQGKGGMNTAKELEIIKKRLEEERGETKKFTKKASSLLSELDKIDRALMRQRAELKKINRRLRRARKDLAKTDKQIVVLDKEKKEYQLVLASRLRAIYKMRSGKATAVLFSSFSTPEAERRYRYLSTVMGSDKELIEGAERNIVELGRQRTRLASINKDILDTRARAGKKKAETTRSRRDKRRLLSSVRRKKDRHTALLKELLAAEADLTAVMEKLGRASLSEDSSEFARRMGKLPMPVRGRVISSFGKKRHPKFKTVTFNNGIVIKAAYGADVKSVFDGRVVYVGWLKGYGQVLIMDNGGGYYTLFAYLSDILIKKGEEVKEGETIALVGDSGPKDLTGLYFELRRKGVPRDPMAWLAAR